MNRRGLYTLATLLLVATVVPNARAQDTAGPAAARPPEIEKLLELGRDPDRLRQAMSDPKQVQDLMRLMESDTVREYFRDPQHLRELLSEVDINQVRETVQSVDPTILRRAALMRTLERLRVQLKPTDEEWKVLAPRIEKLLLAQQDVRAGIRGPGRGGFGGAFGNFGGNNVAPTTEVEEAAADLRDVAQDPTVNSAEAKRRLSIYRKAREKARQRVEDAERDLKELLSQRQEGLLVMLGILE
jgi:hypothetical protein